MCVAVLKPAGAACPSMSVLADCWNANKDGAGVAVSESRSVFIRKGFMKFADFEEWFHKAKLSTRTSQAMVFHFRIGTHGHKDAGNTHPFPVSKNPKVLRQLSGRFPEAVAHNGIFSNTVKLPDVSDTGQFLADCAEAGGDPLKFWDANRSVTGWSRLVVLKPNNEYALRGDWHCVEGSGCLFSNIGWKRYAPVTVVKRAAVGFHGAYGDDPEYQDWWDRVPSGGYGVRKPEAKPATKLGALTTVVKGVKYVARYAQEDMDGKLICAMCAANTEGGGLECEHFGSECTLDRTMYWVRSPDQEGAKPATGIMTPEEVAAAGGVAASSTAVGKALIKVVRTNPSTGEQMVSYIGEGGQEVKGPAATLEAAKATLDGFGGCWSPG